MDYKQLSHAVTHDAAIRRRRRLQPAGGVGDKLFPPTYPREGRDAPPQHVFETRRVARPDGTGLDSVVCVLIDSVQSQANRLEEALVAAAEAGRISLPRLVVDFPSSGLNSIGPISDLQAPHRIFDAILRDSMLDGEEFRQSELGQRLRQSTASDAGAILEVSPASLLFGAWNSTGEGGGIGAKFARAIVSEIIGVNVPVEDFVDRRTGEASMRTAGRQPGSRMDPLGVVRSVEVFKGGAGWAMSKEQAGKGAKQVRPSEINHGNIRPSVAELGVTCDYALQTAVITLAGLRRLGFGGDVAKDQAARAYLAALGLVALAEADAQGYALRSRCDLVCDGEAPLEVVRADGTTERIDLDIGAARALYRAAFEAAFKAGFTLSEAPIKLTPQKKLVALVQRSQEKALSDDTEEDEG
ncbi:MAG: type I-U CRISPR-associated RAMP protein Csb1/Cas7u [Nitratireductor sp.]